VRGYSIPGSDDHGGGLYDAFTRYLADDDQDDGEDGPLTPVQEVRPVPPVDARSDAAQPVPDAQSVPVPEEQQVPDAPSLTSPLPQVPDVPLPDGSARADEKTPPAAHVRRNRTGHCCACRRPTSRRTGDVWHCSTCAGDGDDLDEAAALVQAMLGGQLIEEAS
jgi:type IV secretory pathway VirB10-like protein